MERLFTDELAAIIDEAKEECLTRLFPDNRLARGGVNLMASELEFRIRMRDKEAEIKELRDHLEQVARRE